jgi:hypothetical protein
MFTQPFSNQGASMRHDIVVPNARLPIEFEKKTTLL